MRVLALNAVGFLSVLRRKVWGCTSSGTATDLTHVVLSMTALVHGAFAELSMSCRERQNLAVQLKDTKSVVGRLKSVISIVLHIVFIFFYLMIYNVSSHLSLQYLGRP